MAVDRTSYVWQSQGIAPTDEQDAVYAAGDQPIAGHDNHIMWAVTSDIKALTEYANDHANDHEAGGSQEINLQNLDVGDVAVLNADGDSDELRLLDSGGTSFARFDVGDDRVRQFPQFGTRTVHRAGIDVGGDIDRLDGTTIYDHGDDRFHRAGHALEADEADLAADADALGGDAPSAYIQTDEDRTITGEWTFDVPVDTDITGHASTASQAAVADDANELGGELPSYYAALAEAETVTGDWEHTGRLEYEDPDYGTSQVATRAFTSDLFGRVDAAIASQGVDTTWNFNDTLNYDDNGSGLATEVATERWVENDAVANEAAWAQDSDQVDGYDAAELISDARAGLGPSVDVAANGAIQLEDAEIISFDDHLEVDEQGSLAGISVGTVDNAMEAEYAHNADKVDDYHATDIIAEASAQSGEWTFIDQWETTDAEDRSNDIDINLSGDDIFDSYKAIIVQEVTESKGKDSYVWCQVNGDARHRYDCLHYWYRQHKGWGWGHHESDNRFLLFPTDPKEIGTAEYVFACPQPIVGYANSYPTLAKAHASGHHKSSRTTEFGRLRTDHDEIDELEFWTSRDAALKIQLHGKNITRPRV